MDALLKSRRANVQTLKLMPLFYYHVSHVTVMMRHKLAEKQRY